MNTTIFQLKCIDETSFETTVFMS